MLWLHLSKADSSFWKRWHKMTWFLANLLQGIAEDDIILSCDKGLVLKWEGNLPFLVTFQMVITAF